MHQLVDDQAVQPVRRLVDRHDHSLAHRLGKRADAFRGLAEDVFLLELAVRLEQDQLHFEGQVVLQIGADLLIRAFRVAGDARQVLFELRVVVDLEVVRLVDVPLEVVVVDSVLPVVRDERRLRGGHARRRDQHRGGDQGQEGRRESRRRNAHAHKRYLGLKNGRSVWFDLTVTRRHLQTLCSEISSLARAGVPRASRV